MMVMSKCDFVVSTLRTDLFYNKVMNDAFESQVVKIEEPQLQQPQIDVTEASTSSSYYNVGQSSNMIHINSAEFIHQPQNNFYQV